MSEEYPTFADGRYRIESRLGDGGMAAVFRAWDTRLHVYRAIKCLDPNLSVHPQIRDRFEVEARTMASINHPNIVAVQDIGNEGVRFFIIMELLTGGSLWDRVEKHGVLHPQYAIDAAIAMAKGLGAAHDKKIIHRDVKPHNVLISKDGIPKVTDFGIARIDDGTSKTKTGAVMGTLNYMAPEQRLSARRATAVSDLYAVGVSLYAMMTGHSNEDLFEEEEQDIAFSNFDDNIATFLRKACHRDPKKRHVDAKDMVDELTVLKSKIEPVPEGTSPLFIPFEDSGFDEKPSREEMTRLHTSWSEYGSKDGKVQSSGGSDDTLNLFGDDDDFLGDMGTPTTLENGGVANPQIPMQAQTIAPQMGTMVPGMGQTMHPGMNPNMVGTFHPGMNPNMGQTMHPNMGQTMHPGMNQMASGTFHPGMSVPPGTMPPNVNPSMNQTVMQGMQTNPNLSLNGERTVFQTGESPEASKGKSNNMLPIVLVVLVLAAVGGYFATQNNEPAPVAKEETEKDVGANNTDVVAQLKRNQELQLQLDKDRTNREERRKLEEEKNEVKRITSLIAFDERVLSEKKEYWQKNYAVCIGEEIAKLGKSADAKERAEFNCQKVYTDGTYQKEKDTIEQLKKDLVEAEERAKRSKRKKKKTTTSSASNTTSNPVQSSNQNAVPQGFGFIEIRSIPPFSGLTIDGKSKKANAFGGYQSKKDAPLVATKHVITIYSPTGGQKSKTVMLRPDETFRYCWDFIEEAKCKK